MLRFSDYKTIQCFAGGHYKQNDCFAFAVLFLCYCFGGNTVNAST